MERIVIIPALNPEPLLKDLVKRNWELENQVILVNDGSDEEYMPLFQELMEQCIVLHHRKNRGKGAAIKTALRYIKEELWEYSVIGIMDADGQHLADDMEKLLMKATANPKTLVLGSRTMDETVPWKSRIGNHITCRVFQWTTGIKVSDTQTGLRAFSTDLLDFMLEISGERYEYEMNVLVKAAKEKIPILEVPVHTIYHDGNNSCSHFRKVRDSIRIYRQLLKFSVVSFSSFLLDYGMFVLLTAFMPKMPRFILAANIAARIVSGGYNYTVNCRFVFHEKKSAKSALDYVALAAGILLLNNLLLQMFLQLFHIPVYPSKILTECTLFVISWLVQKEFIFKKKAKKAVQKLGRKRGEWI
ncbi:MAG: glycosyltransferase [Ruminococcus sp.]|jgi:glycosyltransferase involved in cell wall biosynthesis